MDDPNIHAWDESRVNHMSNLRDEIVKIIERNVGEEPCHTNFCVAADEILLAGFVKIDDTLLAALGRCQETNGWPVPRQILEQPIRSASACRPRGEAAARQGWEQMKLKREVQFREQLHAEILKLLNHHVSVSSRGEIGNRATVSYSCTCGKKADFSMSKEKSRSFFDTLIESQHHHEADMLIELFDDKLQEARRRGITKRLLWRDRRPAPATLPDKEKET